ncbi:MAG: rhodanese-like domain-containing protein [Porticoccaceae bacterium]
MDFFVFISEQWLLTSLLLMLIYAFAFLERIKGGKPISARETTQLINAEQAVLVDLREAKDFGEGHIAGAVNIPLGKFEARISELEKYRDKVIILADKLGHQAGATGKALARGGYNVRRLQGGVAEWTNQSLPLVKKK